MFNSINLSQSEIEESRKILLSDALLNSKFHDLILGSEWEYFKEVVKAIHENPIFGNTNHSGAGTNETIAVIDSGFNAQQANHVKFDIQKSLDLTQEGINDVIMHGTAVSAIISLVAPEATQYHVKVFDRNRNFVGRNIDDVVWNLERSFSHIKEVGCTAVNISWNHLTELDENNQCMSRNFFCSCRICKLITDFCEKTGVPVFVSEGNFQDPSSHGRSARRTGSWSCPAAAYLATPVVIYNLGAPAYSTNLDCTYAIRAPGKIQTGKKEKRNLLRIFGANSDDDRPLIGSSFGTPLITGTYAALRSVLYRLGHRHMSINRNPKAENQRSAYSFPLDLMTYPPNEDLYFHQGHHTELFYIYFNCKSQVKHLDSMGKLIEAAELALFTAQLLTPAYKRMENWKFRTPVNVGDMIIENYFAGISLLLETELALMVMNPLEKVKEIAEISKSRGRDTTTIYNSISMIESFYQRNIIKFHFRLTDGMEIGESRRSILKEKFPEY